MGIIEILIWIIVIIMFCLILLDNVGNLFK